MSGGTDSMGGGAPTPADSDAVVTIIGAVGSILCDAWKHRACSDEERLALGELASLAIALRLDDPEQARGHLDSIDAAVRRAHERVGAAERAALVDAGWSPPEGERP